MRLEQESWYCSIRNSPFDRCFAKGPDRWLTEMFDKISKMTQQFNECRATHMLGGDCYEEWSRVEDVRFRVVGLIGFREHDQCSYLNAGLEF